MPFSSQQVLLTQRNPQLPGCSCRTQASLWSLSPSVLTSPSMGLRGPTALSPQPLLLSGLTISRKDPGPPSHWPRPQIYVEQSKHILLHVFCVNGEKDSMTADMVNVANEYRRRDGWMTSPESPSRMSPGDPETAAILQGSLDPSVSYCLVSGGQWIINKLNIQIKTKSANQESVLSASSETSRPWRVDTWHEVFASGPGCGPNLETLSHSLSFPWKP